jgi:hypothetical protein
MAGSGEQGARSHKQHKAGGRGEGSARSRFERTIRKSLKSLLFSLKTTKRERLCGFQGLETPSQSRWFLPHQNLHRFFLRICQISLPFYARLKCNSLPWDQSLASDLPHTSLGDPGPCLMGGKSSRRTAQASPSRPSQLGY